MASTSIQNQIFAEWGRYSNQIKIMTGLSQGRKTSFFTEVVFILYASVSYN